MSEMTIRDAHLRLLADVRKHLEQTERLRQSYERLLEIARQHPTDHGEKRKAVRRDK